MSLPEFKPLDFDISLLTPPRKKTKTVDSKNPSNSLQHSERGILGSGGANQAQTHSCDNDSHEGPASPAGDTRENEQCHTNTCSPDEEGKLESICQDSAMVPVQETDKKGTEKVPLSKMNSPKVVGESDKVKSFQETLQEVKDLLVEAQACQEEMNSLSVKNAVLMNALVMVGADL